MGNKLGYYPVPHAGQPPDQSNVGVSVEHTDHLRNFVCDVHPIFYVEDIIVYLSVLFTPRRLSFWTGYSQHRKFQSHGNSTRWQPTAGYPGDERGFRRYQWELQFCRHVCRVSNERSIISRNAEGSLLSFYNCQPSGPHKYQQNTPLSVQSAICNRLDTSTRPTAKRHTRETTSID